MRPFLGGGDMIANVGFDSSTWNELPWKFEAGTSPIAEGVGLGAAVDYLSGVGMEAVRAHERDLTAYTLERLTEVDGLRTLRAPRTPTPAAAWSASSSRASTPTTSPSSATARASASAPATTAPSR